MSTAAETLVRLLEDVAVYPELLRCAYDQVHPAEGYLYLLDPSSGELLRAAEISSGITRFPRSLPAPPKHTHPDAPADVADLINTSMDRPRNVPDHETRVVWAINGQLALVGMVYGSTLYSFILLRFEHSDVTKDHLDAVFPIADLVFVAQQHNQARAALRAQERPLDITGLSGTFYSEVSSYLRDATGMKFVALRERGPAGSVDEQVLTATAVGGWEMTPDHFTIENFRRYIPFSKAILEREYTMSPERNHPDLVDLWRDFPQLESVESFGVFPITNGERVFAVLSVASSCRLDFTPTFLSVIGGIARSVGVTLLNRQLYFEKEELLRNAFDSSAALDATEVFSDILHQVRNRIILIPENLELIRLKLKKKEINADTLETSRPFVSLQDSYDRILYLLQQAEDAGTPPSLILEDRRVREVWEDAVAMLQHRFDKIGVIPKCHGDAQIYLYPLLFRQVFFHLLLNSVNAFSVRKSIHDRRIDLWIKEEQSQLTLRYLDTAGGIDPSRLRIRGAAESSPMKMRVEDAVFQRGVTSRADGTGHGLWIVKQIVERHRGIVELSKYRDGGVTFEMRIPTDLKAVVSRRKEM